MNLTAALLLFFTIFACDSEEDISSLPAQNENLNIPKEITEKVILTDTLFRATKGLQIGDLEFLPDSGVRSLGGKIVYDAGKVIQNGSFEVKMKGWTAPAQGIDKSHPISGWENKDQYAHYAQKGSFWNWRIGTSYEPFKVLAAPLGIESRHEMRVGRMTELNNGGINTWHTYKVEWNNGQVQFFFDDGLIGSFTFNRFVMRYFLIGKDNQ